MFEIQRSALAAPEFPASDDKVGDDSGMLSGGGLVFGEGFFQEPVKDRGIFAEDEKLFGTATVRESVEAGEIAGGLLGSGCSGGAGGRRIRERRGRRLGAGEILKVLSDHEGTFPKTRMRNR